MANFNKLFLDEIEIGYTPKVQELTKTIEKLEEKKNNMKSKGVYVQKRKDLIIKINGLKNDLKVVKNQADTYVNSISNDLLVINNDIDFIYKLKIFFNTF